MNSLRINVVDNGFTLVFDDPKVREANRSSEQWQDPERQRVYDTAEALLGDLADLLPRLEAEPPGEADVYSAAISEAFTKAEGK